MSEILKQLEEIFKSRGDISFYRTTSKVDFKFFYYKDSPRIQISIQPQLAGQTGGIQKKGNMRYNYKDNQYIMLNALEIYDLIEFVNDKTKDKQEFVHKFNNNMATMAISKFANTTSSYPNFGFLVSQNKNGKSVTQKIIIAFKELLYAIDVQKFFIQSATTLSFIKTGINVQNKYSGNPDDGNTNEEEMNQFEEPNVQPDDSMDPFGFSQFQ